MHASVCVACAMDPCLPLSLVCACLFLCGLWPVASRLSPLCLRLCLSVCASVSASVYRVCMAYTQRGSIHRAIMNACMLGILEPMSHVW